MPFQGGDVYNGVRVAGRRRTRVGSAFLRARRYNTPSECRQKERQTMTIATIIGAVILVSAVLYWLIRAEKKEAHHLDKLHISPTDKDRVL
jgi:hypothetical protein